MRSHETVRTRVPSGENATEKTAPPWPSRTASCLALEVPEARGRVERAGRDVPPVGGEGGAERLGRVALERDLLERASALRDSTAAVSVRTTHRAPVRETTILSMAPPREQVSPGRPRRRSIPGVSVTRVLRPREELIAPWLARRVREADQVALPAVAACISSPPPDPRARRTVERHGEDALAVRCELGRDQLRRVAGQDVEQRCPRGPRGARCGPPTR